jgi:hypothetical protein
MSALVFSCGFDAFGAAGNVNAAGVMAGDWSVSGSAIAIVAPLSSTGYAAQVGISTNITGMLPSSLTRVAGSLRFQINSGNAVVGMWQFRNGTTAAFTLVFNGTSGAIELRTGTHIGTLLNSGGSISLGTTHVLSFDITIGSSGAYAVYLDGNGTALFAGTGNTGNAQASVNQTRIGAPAGVVVDMTYDDLALFDPADPAYNASVLTSNVVVETSFPNGDAQTQFTNDGNVVWPSGIAANGVYSTVAATISVTANSLFLLKVTPAANCTINSVSLLPGGTNSLAKTRGVVYSDSGGSPGSLLSSGTEIIGVTNGATQTLPLTTPQALAAGTPVWIGFITDSSLTLRQVDTTTALGRRIANTYTSGAPASAGAMTAGQSTLFLWGDCTGAAANAVSVMLNPPLGTAASQVRSATVGQEDLYTFPPLVTTPSTIYGAAVKGFVAKSDSGARTVSLHMKSGASDSTGSAPNQAMSTTNQWQRSFFDLDPATGLPWTQTTLNAARSGVSVAS